MNKKIEIIPAILPMDFAEIRDKVELIKGMVKTIQVDVCDGQFVRNATWPYKKNDETFAKLITEEEGLPGWEVTNYEFDLMVNHPAEIVDEWVSVGASRVIMHIEATGDVSEAIEKLQDRAEIGLALNLNTPIEMLKPYDGHFQFIQCMGIEHVGFQGQEFSEKAIEKVKQLRAAYPELPISVDGGVSLENATSLIDAGATRLVVGSAIFNSDNVFEAIQRFKKIGYQG